MKPQTEIVAIVAGVVLMGGAVALEFAGHQAPPELWVAGTAALAGGVGIAIPGGSSSSSAAAAAIASELAKLPIKAPTVSAAGAQPAPAAAAHSTAPAAAAPESPSVVATPAPASVSPHAPAVIR